jgi:hypothetical protein
MSQMRDRNSVPALGAGLPTLVLTARQQSQPLTPADACYHAPIYRQIDIKKSGKTHLIHTAIKPPRVAEAQIEAYHCRNDPHSCMAYRFITNHRREEAAHRLLA